MKIKLSRRDFLKVLGGVAISAWGKGTALAAGVETLHAVNIAAASEGAGKSYGMLVDVSRCVGCQACVRACAAANNWPPPPPVDRLQPKDSPPLASKVWTRVEYRAIRVPQQPEIIRPVKRQCMHCIDPACVSACPAGALFKTKEGPVIYRVDRCIGCRYCMMACPYDIPKFEWSNGLMPVISKCTFCAGRLAQGLQPACADACPVGALKFGYRDELLAEAKARIRAMPGRYINYVYGEHEVGGTNWLYISHVPFEQLGFRMDLPKEPLPKYTWAVASKIPAIIVSLVTFLGGAAYLTHRRPAEHPRPVLQPEGGVAWSRTS